MSEQAKVKFTDEEGNVESGARVILTISRRDLQMSVDTHWVWKSLRTQSVGNWLYYLMSHKRVTNVALPTLPGTTMPSIDGRTLGERSEFNLLCRVATKGTSLSERDSLLTYMHQ